MDGKKFTYLKQAGNDYRIATCVSLCQLISRQSLGRLFQNFNIALGQVLGQCGALLYPTHSEKITPLETIGEATRTYDRTQ